MSYKQLFSTRSMLNAIEQWKEPQTFFQSLFFKETKEHATRFVEVDFFDGNRRIAPFVSRRSQGQEQSKTGYKRFSYEPPYVKPKQNIEPSDLQETLPGENPYTVAEPGTRLIQLRNQILKDLDDQISRREELMAIQAVVNKSITIVDEENKEIQDSIDFTRESTLDFSAATVWSTSATADPLADVRKARKLISKFTGLNADIVVMGSTAADEFIRCTALKELLDIRRVNIGEMVMEMVNAAEAMGAVFIGTFEGVTYFRYDAWYEAPVTGTLTEMIPADKVVVGCSQARNVRHYGCIETIEGPARARRWPKFYDAKDKDPEVYGVQVHSAPLPVTHQPNAFAVITT